LAASRNRMEESAIKVSFRSSEFFYKRVRFLQKYEWHERNVHVITGIFRVTESILFFCVLLFWVWKWDGWL